MQLYQTARSSNLLVRYIPVGILLISFLTAFPGISSAAGVTGESRTYVQLRETADGSDLLPLYEYLNFSVQDLGSETISLHFGGWARYDLMDESFSKDSNSELQYLYLSFKGKTGNTIVNLGRIMVFEGVAAERADGIYAHTDLPANFGVSAYYGAPVETGIGRLGSNSVYGGRLSHQSADIYQIGVSYLKEERDNSELREEEGIDLWLHPVNKVDIVGKSVYNSDTSGWREHTYNLILSPFEKLRLTTEASWINYEDYFTGATMSAFSFQPSALNRGEGVLILGEDVTLGLTDTMKVSVDYKAYDYDIADNAQYYGGALKYAVADSGEAGLTIHRMDGDSDRHKYMEYRLYGLKKINKMDITLDLMAVSYDTPISGEDYAYSASMVAGYNLTEKLRMGADIMYGKNPDFDEDIRVFLKAIYSFDFGSGEGV